jgi:O-antigen/teichoic acid export membrane protein
MTLVSERKIVRAGAINVFYLVIQSLVFLVMTPITLRQLGQELFGFWVIMMSLLGFSIITNLTAATTIMKYVAQYIVSDPENEELSGVITFQYLAAFVGGILTSLFLWLARYWLANQISSSTVPVGLLIGAISIFSLGVVPNILSEVSIGILLGLVRFGTSDFLITLHQLALWVGAFIIGYFNGNIYNLAILILLVSLSKFILSTLAAWYFTRNRQIHFVLDSRQVVGIFKYLFSTWFGAAGLLIMNSIDKIVVGMMLGAATAGIYGIGTSIAIRLSMIADQSTLALNPYASGHEAIGQRLKVTRLFRQSSQMVSIIISAIAGLLLVWLKYILSIWISPEFAGLYSNLFRSLIVAYTFYSMFRPAYHIALGAGWSGVTGSIIFFCSLVMITAVWIFSRLFGITGAILSNYVCSLLLIVNFYLASRLSLKPIRTVISDIGIPSLIILILLILPIDKFGIIFLLIISVVILIVLSILMFRQDRKEIFLKILGRKAA